MLKKHLWEARDFSRVRLHNKCEDDNCPFCSGRPDTPYEVYWNEKESPSDSLARKRWRQDNYFHKENGRLRHEKRKE